MFPRLTDNFFIKNVPLKFLVSISMDKVSTVYIGAYLCCTNKLRLRYNQLFNLGDLHPCHIEDNKLNKLKYEFNNLKLNLKP